MTTQKLSDRSCAPCNGNAVPLDIAPTTHDLDALSENDFIWAARLSELTDRIHETKYHD